MRQDIFDFALEVRAFLEGRWVEWRSARMRSTPAVVSDSMCRISSALLVDLLIERFGGDWEVAGGAGEEGSDLGECNLRQWPGGMRSVLGQWQGHYWAVSKTHGVIVDITADQFGHAPVIVALADDERYRPNYYAKAMRQHLGNVRITKTTWLEQWAGQHPSPGM